MDAIQPALPEALRQLAQAANQAASRHRFEDYQSRRAAHTLRRQQADLNLFAQFLDLFGAPPADLFTQPDAWQPITWGLVEAFVKWQIKQGYAIASVNVRLSTLKTYARLAFQAGSLNAAEYALIRSIQGYSRAEQSRLDARRTEHCRSSKKSLPTPLTPAQAHALKSQPDTPQGRRDTLLMCLLLDHGLRVGEVAALLTADLNLESGMLRFFRPKVNKVQTHRLSVHTLAAVKACANFNELLPEARLLRRTRKDGSLGPAGVTERALTQRVGDLAKRLNIFGLSAHDCRHYWATSAARRGASPFRLQEAGGWSSLAMPRRYIAENSIANDGIVSE